jgi:hypothetical protein
MKNVTKPLLLYVALMRNKAEYALDAVLETPDQARTNISAPAVIKKPPIR